MYQLEKESDENLVVEFKKTQDEYIRGILVNRYKPMINAKADNEDRRNPYIDRQDLYSVYFEALTNAVQSYNPIYKERVSFRNWASVRIKQAHYNLIRNKLYHDETDSQGNRIRTRKKEFPYFAPIEEHLDIPSHTPQKMEETELYEYLREIDENDAKVALLVAEGYTYDQIAKLLDMKNYARVFRSMERNRKRAKNYKK